MFKKESDYKEKPDTAQLSARSESPQSREKVRSNSKSLDKGSQ